MGTWIDFALMSLTFVATIIWNVEVGVLLSVTISLLLVVHKSGKTRMTILVRHNSAYIASTCLMRLSRAVYPAPSDTSP